MILVSGVQAATVTLDITNNIANYMPGQELSGSVKLEYDMYIDPNSRLDAYIDGQKVSTLSLAGYLPGISEYTLIPQAFTYRLAGEGQTQWREYPNQSFTFSVTATGWCGGNVGSSDQVQCYNPSTGQNTCVCPCQGPYPCQWTRSYGTSTPLNINNKEGLKLVAYNPFDVKPTNYPHIWGTSWQTTSFNPSVKAANRVACGGETYAGKQVGKDGWIHDRVLPAASWTTVPGPGITRKGLIEAFDSRSLSQDRGLYNTVNTGGIYKNSAYQQYGSQALWETTNIFLWAAESRQMNITILNWQPTVDTVYTINYLPPRGEKICAYTDSVITRNNPWTAYSQAYQASVEYGTTYTMTFQLNDQEKVPQPPDCPSYVLAEDCITRFASLNYYAEGVDLNGVDFAYTETQSELTVRATTSAIQVEGQYQEIISFNDMDSMAAPDGGVSRLKFILVSPSGAILASDELQVGACTDSDNDGHCSIATGGDDCNDGNRNIKPGATESCNGIDDDCDGETDEDFWGTITSLGDPCGVGLCSGKYVCSSGGSGIQCLANHTYGELPEVCGNEIDEDCDGQPDFQCNTWGQDGECLETSLACFCAENETKTCGSHIGACETGINRCVNGQWSECTGKVDPVTEVCDGIDNDCDGAEDDVDNGESVALTRCQCYGSGSPKTETCNEVDDDCDGKIDETLTCCVDGDTQKCGIAVGICTKGTQTCERGSWGTCVGETKPKAETCNQLDDDCDGQTDEGSVCDTLQNDTCINWIQDEYEEGIDCGGSCPDDCQEPIPYFDVMLVMAGVTILIILILLIVYFKKQGRELTWEEVTKKWGG